MKRKSIRTTNSSTSTRSIRSTRNTRNTGSTSTSTNTSSSTRTSTRSTRATNPVYVDQSPADEHAPPDTAVEKVATDVDSAYKEVANNESDYEEEDSDYKEEAEKQLSKPKIPPHWPQDESFPPRTRDVPPKFWNSDREEVTTRPSFNGTGHHWILKENTKGSRKKDYLRIAPQTIQPTLKVAKKKKDRVSFDFYLFLLFLLIFLQ